MLKNDELLRALELHVKVTVVQIAVTLAEVIATVWSHLAQVPERLILANKPEQDRSPPKAPDKVPWVFISVRAHNEALSRYTDKYCQ